jgi:hypothetical protein
MHTTRTYSQYSATADLHNLQFTAVHALGFSGSTSRILTADLNTEYHFKSLWSFLAISYSITLNCQVSRTRPNSTCSVSSSYKRTLLIWTRHGPHRKHLVCCQNCYATYQQAVAWSTDNAAPTVACLLNPHILSRCLAMDVLLRKCLPSRCLAMVIFVTIRYLELLDLSPKPNNSCLKTPF